MPGAKNYIIRPIIPGPGIQRDGTPFASKTCIDGQWVRFYIGLPRKIGGYQMIDIGNDEIIRSMYSVSREATQDVIVYLGRAASLKYNIFDLNGDSQLPGGNEVDRTPTNYATYADPNNVWDFDLFTTKEVPSLTNPASSIVAHVAPNGNNIGNQTRGPIYYGDTTLNTPLMPITDATHGTDFLVSGGVLFLAPFLIAYDNNGTIYWTETGVITTIKPTENVLVISNKKIMKGMVTRGSSTPQALFWTRTSVIAVSYTIVETTETFTYTNIQDGLTLMSPNSIVAYNQQFFWIGTDQFYQFNGLVTRLPNNMSTDWFFQNVNLMQRAKVWGVLVSRYDEIWWHYPRNITNQDGTITIATECNAVIIYNVGLQTWYDSPIDRAAGISASVFPLPLMSDASPTITPVQGGGQQNSYALWQHEYGVDQAYNQNVLVRAPQSISSGFETNIITLFESSGDPDNNRLIRNRRLEVDFAQVGNMTVTVNNRMYASDTLANGRLIQTKPVTFGPNTQAIDDIASQGRLVSLVFSSNVVGGTYQTGQTMFDFDVGDINAPVIDSGEIL